jgi:hypothetical protein
MQNVASPAKSHDGPAPVALSPDPSGDTASYWLHA